MAPLSRSFSNIRPRLATRARDVGAQLRKGLGRAMMEKRLCEEVGDARWRIGSIAALEEPHRPAGLSTTR